MEFNRVLFIFNTPAATFRFPMENFFGSHSTAGSITSAELIKVLEIIPKIGFRNTKLMQIKTK